MLEKLMGIIAGVMGIDAFDVPADMEFFTGEYALSNIDFAHLIMLCERVFKIDIHDTDLIDVVDIPSLMQCIERAVDEQ